MTCTRYWRFVEKKKQKQQHLVQGNHVDWTQNNNSIKVDLPILFVRFLKMVKFTTKQLIRIDLLFIFFISLLNISQTKRYFRLNFLIFYSYIQCCVHFFNSIGFLLFFPFFSLFGCFNTLMNENVNF